MADTVATEGNFLEIDQFSRGNRKKREECYDINDNRENEDLIE